MAPISGRLSDKHAAGVLGSVGLALLGAGMLFLALLPSEPSIFSIVWRIALCGCGFGFFQIPNVRAIMSSAPIKRSGSASSIIATSRLTGQAIGTGLASLCFGVAGHNGAALAIAIGSAFAVLGCLVSVARVFVPRETSELGV
jgi:DHA2 family multidrug resistance protein-like MFS transporter